MKTSFSISELAREYQITPRAIRFYESEGMIAPARQGQTRIFSGRDRARLGLIVQGKRVGFSLAEIREMLDLYDIGDGREVQRKVTLERCRDRITLLERQKHDIDAAIAELNEFIALVESKQTIKG